MGFLRSLFGKKESTPTISFDEIQSIFRTTLTPLGFEEKEEEEGRIRGAQYSRDELLVWLTTDVLDAVYFSGASSKTEIVNDNKRHIPDFAIECVNIDNANEFKNESVAKLNEWLVKQGLR